MPDTPPALAGLEKAVDQMPDPPIGPALIVLCPHRRWPMSLHSQPVLTRLIGSTTQRGRVVGLDYERRGTFYGHRMRHVGAVAIVDYVRAESVQGYACTLVVNPNADARAAVDARWFPHARVCARAGRAWRWSAPPPSDSTVPDGTAETWGA